MRVQVEQSSTITHEVQMKLLALTTAKLHGIYGASGKAL